MCIHLQLCKILTTIIACTFPLSIDQTLTLCLNNYRASGAGGYGCYKSCPLVSENLTEISDLVTQYVLQHREITVDKTKWLQFCSD